MNGGRPVPAHPVRRLGAASTRIRALALLAAGSLLVHELTYSARALEPPRPHSVHGYIPFAAAAVLLLLLAAAVLFARDLLLARRGHAVAAQGPSFRCAWLGASVWLAAVYLVQEWLESSAASHAEHETIASGRGWTVFVFALLVGALVALLLRGAEKALRLAGAPDVARRTDDGGSRRLQPWPDRPRLVGLAWHLAGRAPPLFAR
jgi:hypothetical protein